VAREVIVIGSGPGGYVAAIKAAQLGAHVTLVEKDALGGTCLNRGCIPTKFFRESAGLLSRIEEAEAFGISVQGVSVDFPAVVKRKEAVVNKLIKGLVALMKKNKIDVVTGTASLVDAGTVRVLESGLELSADTTIIATGSKSASPPIKGADTPNVMSSDEMLASQQLPSSLAVVGGGVVGLEFAQFLARMGTKVTVIEVLPQILAGEDAEISTQLQRLLTRGGVKVLTNTFVTSIGEGPKGQKAVTFVTGEGGTEEVLIVERVMLSTGRVPNLDDLNASALGLKLDGTRLVVDDLMATNVPGIYAIGDVVGSPMLAHVAMEEGKCAAVNALTGGSAKMDYGIVPMCVYTSPEVASVGLTEAEARDKFGEVRIGRFPFAANGRSMIANSAKGMVKVIADTRYGEILGVHILGPQATELIAECIMAMRLEATIDELGSTIHAHPTASEAVAESALDALGMRIH
jgi:dihydrolipoamide dehydrogenase